MLSTHIGYNCDPSYWKGAVESDNEYSDLDAFYKKGYELPVQEFGQVFTMLY